ncbi:hypothetical protein [Ancrocorticia populi]|uniref:Uncharacterized protein n=1 Tax=Ancrocorticia populi TaxID=2175228 RepID=A0A2V1KAF9_9ACTO|nr:hypothetical protein [Ancrocorticia populi]PWF27300.1 hypothetical protein DD236_02615 [Ancrocorticia populi]
MADEWQVEQGTGWIPLAGFGQINPRRDNEEGGRTYFTAQTANGEYAKATGDSIAGGPETWDYGLDQPFLLVDSSGNCVEVMIALLEGGRYAVKSKPGSWPITEAGAS